MVIFSKVLFRNLLYHSYVKVSSQQLWDTLRLKILWTWIKIRANCFIKTLVNNVKGKSTKLPWALSLAKKNSTPHFKERCTKIDIHFHVSFLSQASLVFKSNPLFIDILDSFCHSLLTFLPFDFCLYSIDCEVYSLLLCLFYQN